MTSIIPILHFGRVVPELYRKLLPRGSPQNSLPSPMILGGTLHVLLCVSFLGDSLQDSLVMLGRNLRGILGPSEGGDSRDSRRYGGTFRMFFRGWALHGGLSAGSGVGHSRQLKLTCKVPLATMPIWATRGRHHAWPLAMFCSCRAFLSGCCTFYDVRAGGQGLSHSPCFCTFSIVQPAAKLSLLLGLALSLAPPSHVM